MESTKKANLLISCKDTPGIVKTITGFLLSHNANIANLEQHIENDLFFMRIEWELDNFTIKNRQEFLSKFSYIQKQYDITLTLALCNKKIKVGLLFSREPHCLIDILSRVEIHELNIEIPFVISNFNDWRSIVEKFNIPFYYIPTKKNSVEHEKEILNIVQKYDTDLLALARYMKILSQDLIKNVNQKIINVHHSFLPSFIGANPYDEAYKRGVKLIGATSHYVTEELDQGPIIEQSIQRVKHIYDTTNLKLIGRSCEKEVFYFAIKKHIENKIITFNNKTIIFE